MYYWTELYKWADESKYFTEKEMSILSTTLRLKSKTPLEKQCKVILEIEAIAIDDGFYYKQK